MKSVAPFVSKLHSMLQQEATASPIVSWAHHDTAFVIHDVEALEAHLLPKYFNSTKYKSFQRQLHYFGFRKWTKTMASVCTYSHPHFQRHAIKLMTQIQRKARSRVPRQKNKHIAPPVQGLDNRFTAPCGCPQLNPDPALYYNEYDVEEIMDWFVCHYSIN